MPSSNRDESMANVIYLTAKGKHIVVPPLSMQVSVSIQVREFLTRTSVDLLVEDAESLALDLAEIIVAAIVWPST